MQPSPRQMLRFGEFELDVEGYELRRKGRPVRLERQPMELLLLLIERRRALVTRAEIVTRLWGPDVFVDVEMGINTAIRKIRQALRETASGRRPAFVETVPGKGYRFVAEVVASGRTDEASAMLAVLPFVNLDGDTEREYLAEGFTDEAIAALSQLDPGRLRVIGRRSVMAYKLTQKPLATIAADLNAQFIVEGSVAGDGDALRIRCTLNRMSDLAQLWSGAYDRTSRDLAHVARDLATAVADRIHLQLSAVRMTGIAERQSRDAAAYDAYLRGRRFWNQLTPATTRKATEYYRRATDIDPEYALAWSGLAEAFASAPINGDADPREMWPRARESAQRALQANPDLSESHHVCGQVDWFFEWNWPGAMASFGRAIGLDASSAWSHTMLGHVLSQCGRHDEGRPYMERACTLEPMSPLHCAMASQVAFQARDFDSAVQLARRAIVIDPEFWVGYMMLGQTYEQLGATDMALDALSSAVRLSDGNSKPVGLRGYILARSGQVGAARDVLAMLDDVARLRYVPPFAFALVAAGLGEHDRVMAHLHRAYDARDVHLAFLTVDPKWDQYHSRGEFAALLQRCGFHRSAIVPELARRTTTT